MSHIDELLAIMARLRDPERGCPWDRAQTFASIVPHTIEEAYEVADSIERGAAAELCDELGDLLFQTVFYAQLAREQGHFDFDDVVAAICDKLVRRHPHVFGEGEVADVAAQSSDWERRKAEERRLAANGTGQPHSALDGVARTLPAVTRAGKLQRRAALVGFDWEHVDGVVDKVAEELDEVRAALASPESERAVAEEIGDLLFSCVNLARHAGVDSEAVLRAANQKFETRFRQMERRAAGQGCTLENMTPAELDRLWEAVK